MSNLKKILALVLALVMSFSLVSIAGAAFTDADKITDKYELATGVLSTLEVFQGRENGNFDPQAPISRAEVAAIIYRVATGDVKNVQVGLYSDYNKFTDVKSGYWYAGYVNYCANAEYVKGVSATEFQPDAYVTGYQVLAMILRAVGYDKADEFTGPNWQVHVAQYAQQLGITKNISDVTLGTTATRELVAELLFRTIAYVPQVTYTVLGGYSDRDNALNWGPENDTLGEAIFDLETLGVVNNVDPWGRPTIVWFCDENNNGFTPKTDLFYVQYLEPVLTYTEEVTECDIVKDMGAEFDVDFLAVNGNVASNVQTATFFSGDNDIEKTGTREYVGKQGRLTEIYVDEKENVYVVMVDEFLGKVTGTSEVTYDKNGHIDQYAKLFVTVYTNATNVAKNVVFESETDWEYAEGDYILLAAKTDSIYGKSNVAAKYEYDEAYEIIGEADYINAAQTAITTKASHWVGGTEYFDAYRFGLDNCGLNTTEKHTWFFDSFGNVIGVDDLVVDYSYATISAIKWVDSNNLLEDGYAMATLTYMDGAQETVPVASIWYNGDAKATTLTNVDGTVAEYDLGTVSDTKQANKKEYTNVALYRVEENAKGQKVLIETIDLTGQNVQITTGVPALTTAAPEYNAGNTTKFLVWYNGEYTPYTGIKSIPTYITGSAAHYWVVDVNTDGHAEYVFVSDPKVSTKDTVSTHSYFVFNADDLVLTRELDENKDNVYVITGAYVDGAVDTEGTVKIKASATGAGAMLTELMTDTNELKIITVTNKYVTKVQTVQTTALSFDGGKAIYAMAAKDAKLVDGILTADITNADGTVSDCSYDVEGAVTISHDGVISLHSALNDANAYLYIVYSVVGTNEKVASHIFVTTKQGTVSTETPVTDPTEIALKNADDAIKAAEAAIAAAAAKLGLATTTATDDHLYHFNTVEATIGAAEDEKGLTAALTALKGIDLKELTEEQANKVATMIVKLEKTIKTVMATLVEIALDAVETASDMYAKLEEDATTAEKAAVAKKAAVADTLLNTRINDYVTEIDDNDNSVSEDIADVKAEWAPVKSEIDTATGDAITEELNNAKDAAEKALKDAIWAAIKAHKDYKAAWKLVKADVMADNEIVVVEEGSVKMAGFISTEKGKLTTLALIDAFNKDLADAKSALSAKIKAVAAAYVAGYIKTQPTDAKVTLELREGVAALFSKNTLTVVVDDGKTLAEVVTAGNLMTKYLGVTKDSIYAVEEDAKYYQITEVQGKDQFKVEFAGLNGGEAQTITVTVVAADETKAVEILKAANTAKVEAAKKALDKFSAKVITNAPTEENVRKAVLDQLAAKVTGADCGVVKFKGDWSAPAAFGNKDYTFTVVISAGEDETEVKAEIQVVVNVTYDPTATAQ